MDSTPRYGPPTTGDPGTHTFLVDVGPDETVQVRGTRIGFASSKMQTHNHTGDRRSPNSGPRCSACRWFEVHLFRTTEDEYVVHTAGHSNLPDEVPLYKLARTRSPYEVVEILTIRRSGATVIPGPSARVLAQAAQFDRGILDAYSMGPIPSGTTAA